MPYSLPCGLLLSRFQKGDGFQTLTNTERHSAGIAEISFAVNLAPNTVYPLGANLQVPVRNVGPGPAFIRRVLISPVPGTVFEGQIDSQVIPSGELASTSLNITDSEPGFPALHAAHEGGGTVNVGVLYSDVAGGQRTQTEFRLRRSTLPPYRLTVEQVRLFECDDKWIRSEQPFASSGIEESN